MWEKCGVVSGVLQVMGQWNKSSIADIPHANQVSARIVSTLFITGLHLVIVVRGLGGDVAGEGGRHVDHREGERRPEEEKSKRRIRSRFKVEPNRSATHAHTCQPSASR